MIDLVDGSDGLVIGSVAEENLGYPQRYLFLIGLEFNVLLEVLKTVFN